MPWYAIALCVLGISLVGYIGVLACLCTCRARRPRPGISARLVARLGGQCSICHQIGHTSQEHVRLPNSLLQARRKDSSFIR